jgi:hypothetical protein
MPNLQDVLIGLFNEMDDEEVKQIVSEVYSVEKEYIDFHQNPHGILERIKDIVDSHARYILRNEGQDEN